MNRYVVVDLETTGHAPANGDKIIEIGIVVIENDTITEQFQSMVNPGISIPPFISQLTGISDEDVSDAPIFEEIADEVGRFFKDSYVVAHNAAFDLKFLNAELSLAGRKKIKQPVLDTVELSRILLPSAPGYKLSLLSEHLQLSHDHPHRALSDTLVTAELLIALLTKMQRLPYETLAGLSKLQRKLNSDLGVLLQEFIDEKAFEAEEDAIEVVRGLAIKKPKQEQELETGEMLSFGELAAKLYDSGGLLDNALPGYEKRTSQQEMSEEVYAAFSAEQHALLEAETGTGKSLAYLLPAIYTAVKTNERVVISTHLTQLQTQLLDKEIPLLQQLLPFSFQAALLKGKQHYLSLSRFEQILQSPDEDNYDTALTKAILLVWLTETDTGDLDEVNLPSSGKRFFTQVSADTETASDPFSPWFSKSFYQRAKKAAWQADLVVTNHALLCTDMQDEYQLLPSYKRVIIDEAHHLEAAAAKHFGLTLDYVTVTHILNAANTSFLKAEEKAESSLGLNWHKMWDDIKQEADELFRYVFDFVAKQNNHKLGQNDIGRMQYRLRSDEGQAEQLSIAEMASRVTFGIRDCMHALYQLAQILERDGEDSEELRSTADRMQTVIDGLERMFLIQKQEEVKWLEIEAYGARNAVYLFCEPMDISEAMVQQFFNKKKSVIMTSATLTIDQSFDYLMKRLGLPEEKTVTKKFTSPYAYEDQVQLLVPSDFPDIRGKDNYPFIYAVCEAIVSLAEITDGRMLVLFTSYDMLKKSYGLLKELTADLDYTFIAQGVTSGSRDRLKKNFQSHKRSILLGTSSFWEGVDIPGEDLSCLVIVRLPFQPPDHPIYEAKAAKLKQENHNPFMELALPNAVVRFKQGFGRLIRSSTDRGIVFVCDDRLVKSRYGRYFTASIPKVPTHYGSTTEILTKAEDWM